MCRRDHEALLCSPLCVRKSSLLAAAASAWIWGSFPGGSAPLKGRYAVLFCVWSSTVSGVANSVKAGAAQASLLHPWLDRSRLSACGSGHFASGTGLLQHLHCKSCSPLPFQPDCRGRGPLRFGVSVLGLRAQKIDGLSAFMVGFEPP